MDRYTELAALLEELNGVFAAPNFEYDMRAYLKKACAPYADEIMEDAVGNILVLRKGKKQTDRPVAVWNRLDEAAFMVRDVNSDGTFTFESMDGWVQGSVAAGKFLIIPRTGAKAVVPLRAIHMTPRSQRGSMPELESLFGELGTDSAEEAKDLVEKGDLAFFDVPFTRLGESGFSMRAPAVRAGVAIALRLFRDKPEVDTWFIFGTKGELSPYFSAVTSGHRIEPRFALGFQPVDANDLPDVKEEDRTACLRKGPMLGTNPRIDRTLNYLVCGEAKKLGVPFQTDAYFCPRILGAFKAVGAGITPFGIGIPERYQRSAFPIADLGDVANAESLARIALRKGAALCD